MIKSAYSEKNRPQTENLEQTMTKQALAEQQNINNIIKRYTKTGLLPELRNLELQYGEITSESLMDAYNQIEQAQEAFMQVPSSIRKQFDNDAGKFIDYATNTANINQMREWGLAIKQTPEAPITPEVEVQQDGSTVKNEE